MRRRVLPLRVPRRLLVAAVAVLLALGPVLIVAAQQQRRWIDPAYPYTVCETCHRPPNEDFAPVELVTLVPPEVPAGEAFNATVVVVNPWLHRIRKIDAALNLSGAEGRVTFAEGGTDQSFDFQGRMPRGEQRTRPLQVRPGLTRFATTFEGSPGLLDGNRWQVDVTFPTAQTRSFEVPARDGGSFRRTVEWTGGEIPSNASGEWVVKVRMLDSNNLTGEHAWRIDGRLEYAVEDVLHRSALADPSIRDVPALGHEVVPFRLRSEDRGTWEARFEVRVELYFLHPPGTGGTDSTFVTDTATVRAVVGDEFIPAPEYRPTTRTPTGTGAFMQSWGKVTGFASLLMILPTLLFVGLFGRDNKHAMNRFFGSARNRVVWHAAVSWIIISLAAVHALLFVLEPRFDELDMQAFRWTTGWAALAAMVGLGVTGLWQIPFTKRLGYRWWRRLHMALGIAAFALSIVHTLYDGSDFQWFLQDLRPDLGQAAAVVLGGWVGWAG